MLMNKFITTLLCLAGSAILFNANAVEREYTQFTAFNADGSIPNGKYIMVFAPSSSTSFFYMNPLKDHSTGLSADSVTCDGSRNFKADSSCELTIQNTSGNYSLITTNSKYLYSNAGYDLQEHSSNGKDAWSYTYNPSDASNQSAHCVKFAVSSRCIQYRKKSSDFTAVPKSAYYVSSQKNFPYPTLYTVVPTLSAVASNISGIKSIANGDVLNVLKDHVAAGGGNVNVQVNYATRLEYKINGGSVQSSTSDSFSLDQAVAKEVGQTKVEVTAYDANGTAYNLNFTINVGEAPVIPQNDEAVFQGSQENTWSTNVTESDATGVSLTTYNIDGSSTVEPKGDGILTISDFSLKNARYIVKASNNFLADQSLEFNFISTINNKLSDLYGEDGVPYQAFIVLTNNSDRFTEGYPHSIEIPMTPNGDYTQWTCDFDNILGKSAQDLFYYIPWIALEYKIELKIVPRDSNTPMILSGKGMSVAEMPGCNREAAAKILAQDSSAYSFVVDGGDTLIYNAGLSTDESTYNMIAGSAKFEPFVTNSITLSRSSNIETGISDINPDANEAEYYNLQGIRVDNPQQGIYIRRQGNKTTKVIL